MRDKRARGVAVKAIDNAASAAVQPAAVVAVAEDGRVEVRLASGGSQRTRPATARLALAGPYRPAPGDRVLVAAGADELYIVGVLHAEAPPAVMLPDGATVTVRGEAAEIRDAGGRLLVRYAGGCAEIAAPAGDLTLSAPEGRVVVRSGADIELDATRDVQHRAGRAVEIHAGAAEGGPQLRVSTAEARLDVERIEVKTAHGRVVAEQATVLAGRIATTASVLTQSVERFELTATRLIEKTRDTFRDASDLAQTRVGRARMIVKDVFALHSRRTSMTSKDDTSIDGSKILLG